MFELFEEPPIALVSKYWAVIYQRCYKKVGGWVWLSQMLVLTSVPGLSGRIRWNIYEKSRF